MKQLIFIITTCLVLVSCGIEAKPTSSDYLCYFADLISDDEDTNNQASPLEICISSSREHRRLRLFDGEKVMVQIIAPPAISVRERMYLCSDYFLLSEGSDSENVLGHYYDNIVYRISDGEEMTSFSSLDLVKMTAQYLNSKRQVYV